MEENMCYIHELGKAIVDSFICILQMMNCNLNCLCDDTIAMSVRGQNTCYPLDGPARDYAILLHASEVGSPTNFDHKIFFEELGQTIDSSENQFRS